MFKPKQCSLCLEKDNRIEDLKEQIRYYRSVLNPPPKITKYELEETAVLNGGGQQIDPAQMEQEEVQNEETRRELDSLFSGNYIELPTEN